MHPKRARDQGPSGAAFDSEGGAKVLRRALVRDPDPVVERDVGDSPDDAPRKGLVRTNREAPPRGTEHAVAIVPGGDTQRALEALRGGAFALCVEPCSDAELAEAQHRAEAWLELSHYLEDLPECARRMAEEGLLLGESESIRGLRALLERMAHVEATVLLTGESGTGKGVAARLLHGMGPRAEGPFVAINCAAIPEHLLEAELFGHERGAFTDATRSRNGLLVAAHRGTLFLDEIDTLPLQLQAKLLRALDQRTVRPVGGRQEVPFDARLVAATNRNLREAIEGGRFRQDLYFRLKVLGAHLPALRERGRDVLLLAQHFIDRAYRPERPIRGMTVEAAQKLLDHQWPGNVRELENCIQRALTIARYDHLTPDTLQLTQAPAGDHLEDEALVPLELMELDHVARAMTLAGGDVGRASSLLAISPRTLRRRLQRWGLVGHGGTE